MKKQEVPTFRSLTIITQYFAPEPGAPQIRLRVMARELRRIGVDVRVITGMPNYPVGEIFEGYRGRLLMTDSVDGHPVKRVWLYAATGRNPLRRLLNYLSFSTTGLVALLFSAKADLVFVEAQPITLGVAGWVMKRLRGVPYIYNTPDLQVEHAEEAGWLRPRPMIGLARGLEAFLMRHALSVTTVTHAFMEHFVATRGVPRSRITFLPNGADTDALRPLPYDPAYAERLGVAGRKVFTFAGTHAPYQGLEVIIEAAELLRHREDIAILMVGKGPVRRRLIEMVEQAGLRNVVFGESPFDETAQLMSITYASLVTLKKQPSSTMQRLSKTIPPLACGVPVIFAGEGESPQILEREGCGVQVEPERADLLAKAIEALADDPATRDEMGRCGRVLAERDFSWETIVRDWVRQIEAVCAGRDPDVPGLRPSLAPMGRP